MCFFGAAPPSTHPSEGFSLSVGNGLLCKLMQLGIHQQEQDMDRWIVVGRFVNVRFGNPVDPTGTPGLSINVIVFVIVDIVVNQLGFYNNVFVIFFMLLFYVIFDLIVNIQV